MGNLVPGENCQPALLRHKLPTGTRKAQLQRPSLHTKGGRAEWLLIPPRQWEGELLPIVHPDGVIQAASDFSFTLCLSTEPKYT